jgi:hypothetical protein
MTAALSAATIPRVMSRTPHRANRSLAMVLAVLALLAQVWVGQVSTSHLGQMLSQARWGDVCTAQATPHGKDTPDGTQGHAMGSALSCPVCVVAGAGLAPSPTPAVAALRQTAADYRLAWASAPARALRHTNVRPPAQAPPVA